LRTSSRTNSRRNHEQGIVILLVAVVLLFVVGAMAALAIDVVTFYTARSEAQLAADGAALAGARVLANSGLTSAADPLGAEALATTIATQVAVNNNVGGRALSRAEVVVTFNDGATTFTTNPQVTVRVQRTDLPTFFARIWGTTQVTVAASATAEAYNPSGAYALVGTTTPVAPICVKPWLLPNMNPSGGTTIFDATTGAITNPAAWRYYPGDPATTFPPPTQALPICTPAMTTPYEESIAGCVQTPIACNIQANIDTSDYFNRRRETAEAVNCLTHAQGDEGDQVDLTATPSPPFQFLAGNDNPIPGLAGNDVTVSDSLVTVPVFNSVNGTPPTNPVTIIGFVQLFLNPDGHAAPSFGFNRGQVKTTVINMAGCGTGSIGQQPILGNGASPVPVRLISPP